MENASANLGLFKTLQTKTPVFPAMEIASNALRKISALLA